MPKSMGLIFVCYQSPLRRKQKEREPMFRLPDCDSVLRFR